MDSIIPNNDPSQLTESNSTIYSTSTPLSSLVYDSGYSTGESVEQSTIYSLSSQVDSYNYYNSFSPTDFTPNIRLSGTNYNLPIPKFSLSSPDFSDSRSPGFKICLDENPVKTPSLLAIKSWRNIVTVPRYGQDVGVEDVDFIKELRNYSPALSRIISYLDDKDLKCARNVSTTWNKIIDEQLKSLPPNLIKSPEHLRKRPKPQCMTEICTRYPFDSIQNKFSNFCISGENEKSNTSQNNLIIDKHENYKEEAKKLISCEFLWPCPRCNSPARITPFVNRGRCTRISCEYNFCYNCKTDFHSSTPCPVKNIVNCSIIGKNTQIGSEKSKKNLRRL